MSGFCIYNTFQLIDIYIPQGILKLFCSSFIGEGFLYVLHYAQHNQLQRKEKTDEKLLFSFCLKRSHEEEFFIRKAIGWALRQYCRSNRKAVKNFVTANKDSLSQLSIREALKHCR